MKTVGVIGGMGPLATAAFHRLVVLNTMADRDQDHVPVIVDSDPRVPDRTAFLLGIGEDPRPALIRSARRLSAAGAQLLVMPCNTAYAFRGDIEEATGLLMVPWLDTAVASTIAPPWGALSRCGLLATTGTLRVGLYARLFAERGVETVEPDASHQSAVMAAIYEPDGVKATGTISDRLRIGLLGAARHLVERGAEALLLGCTEIPLAIPSGDPSWPRRAVDPAVEVARRTVVMAGGTVTPSPATG